MVARVIQKVINKVVTPLGLPRWRWRKRVPPRALVRRDHRLLDTRLYMSPCIDYDKPFFELRDAPEGRFHWCTLCAPSRHSMEAPRNIALQGKDYTPA
jgi:hypothetical protein